jgi:hypothetical protein
VGSATTGFCHLGGIHQVRHQQTWDLSGQFNRLVSPSFFIRDAASAICISIISDLYAASEEGKQQPRQSRSILGSLGVALPLTRLAAQQHTFDCVWQRPIGFLYSIWSSLSLITQSIDYFIDPRI